MTTSCFESLFQFPELNPPYPIPLIIIPQISVQLFKLFLTTEGQNPSDVAHAWIVLTNQRPSLFSMVDMSL